MRSKAVRLLFCLLVLGWLTAGSGRVTAKNLCAGDGDLCDENNECCSNLFCQPVVGTCHVMCGNDGESCNFPDGCCPGNWCGGSGCVAIPELTEK